MKYTLTDDVSQFLNLLADRKTVAESAVNTEINFLKNAFSTEIDTATIIARKFLVEIKGN